MTVKERLHQLVESMSDDQAENALRLLGADLAEGTAADSEIRSLPNWIGAYRGPGDVVERIDDYLAEGFGR
jgi:hypothetical protein